MLTDFWSRPEFYAYERACGDEPGTRARLLANATWKTRVLELTASEEELWKGVRSSYHSLINKLAKDDDFSISQTDPLHFGLARIVHYQAAGRETRSDESWRIQAQWLTVGCGRCWLATKLNDGIRRETSAVGFIYVLVPPPTSSFFSAAALEPTIGHPFVSLTQRGQ